MTKECNRCGQAKPIADFYKERGRPAGRCKECHRAAVTAWRRANPEKVAANNRRNQTRRRLRMAEFLRRAKDQPCADCGGRYPYWVMHFHHANGTKEFAIGDRWWHPSITRLKAEIAKCILLCANCHALRHPPSPTGGTTMPGRKTLRSDAGF